MLRVLLFVARPRTTVLGNIPNSMIYRRMDQFSEAQAIPGVLILHVDAPIYFANACYLRERYPKPHVSTLRVHSLHGRRPPL